MAAPLDDVTAYPKPSKNVTLKMFLYPLLWLLFPPPSPFPFYMPVQKAEIEANLPAGAFFLTGNSLLDKMCSTDKVLMGETT